VVVRDHELEDVLMAFDKTTGEELWRTRRDEPTSWSTPLIVVHDGRPQVVVASTSGLRGYDLHSGAELWSGPALTDSVIPTPIRVHDTIVAMSDYRKRIAYAVSIGRTGEFTDGEGIAWSYEGSAPYVASPLFTHGLIYFISKTTGRLTCLESDTGKPCFEAEPLPELHNTYASPVAVEGRVYVLGREGTCVVLKPGADLEVLVVNSLDEATDASMALVGDDVFIRGDKSLYCISQR
jgi:outer membrane protein assembly factor BamB